MAQGGTASQSSTLEACLSEKDGRHAPRDAIDGDISYTEYDCKYSHTEEQAGPWWQVDLLHEFHVAAVALSARKNVREWRSLVRLTWVVVGHHNAMAKAEDALPLVHVRKERHTENGHTATGTYTDRERKREREREKHTHTHTHKQTFALSHTRTHEHTHSHLFAHTHTRTLFPLQLSVSRISTSPYPTTPAVTSRTSARTSRSRSRPWRRASTCVCARPAVAT